MSSGGGDPKVGSMPQLELALRGTRKEQAGQPKPSRLPITPAILWKMRQVWDRQAANWDHVMLWAACCLGFFGFLRSGELTAPEEGEFDPRQHLSFQDIVVDDPVNPRTMSIHIKQSKTDPSGRASQPSWERPTPRCPSGSPIGLPVPARSGRGPALSLQRGPSTDKTTPGHSDQKYLSRGRPQAGRVRRPRLQNRSSHHGSRMRGACRHHQDPGALEERGLPAVCETATRATGRYKSDPGVQQDLKTLL